MSQSRMLGDMLRLKGHYPRGPGRRESRSAEGQALRGFCSALLSPAHWPAVCHAGLAPGLWMFPDFGLGTRNSRVSGPWGPIPQAQGAHLPQTSLLVGLVSWGWGLRGSGPPRTGT